KRGKSVFVQDLASFLFVVARRGGDFGAIYCPHSAYTMLATGVFQNSIRYVCIDFRSVPLKPLNLYTLQNANFKSSEVTTVPFAEASFPWVRMASMTSSFIFHNGLSNILFSNSSLFVIVWFPTISQWILSVMFSITKVLSLLAKAM